MSENEKPPEGGEIVSLDDARQKKAEAESKGEPEAKPADPLGNALQPIMAAIARELAGMAGPDGTVKLDQLSDDEQSKLKTQALLRGLGQGLGDVLAQALGKWADKVNLNFTMAPGDAPKGEVIQPTPVRTPDPPSPGAPEDPTKKS